MKIDCIAIDDEPIALKILMEYCSKVPGLTLREVFNSPLEAVEYLKGNRPDLIFLDIRMPEISGITVAESIEESIPVVFTTAHSEYAVKSYNLNAVDYLLKPFDFNRFYRAIEKVDRILHYPGGPEGNENDGSVVVKVEYRNVKIRFSEILYCRSMDNYVKVITNGTTHLTQQTLKSLERQLPGDRFIRVHRSYIIPISRIRYFSSSTVTIGDLTIPVGRAYREDFLNRVTQ